MKSKIGRVLVVGAGVSGIRAAIDLAQIGYRVILADSAPHVGGILSQLDYQFPTDRCGMCRMLPMMDRDAGVQTCLRKGLFHSNIDIRLGASLAAVDGEAGKFDVTLRQPANPIDPGRCIGCGLCSQACPVEVADEFNAGLTRRKAVYLPVPHQIPNAYTVDLDACTRCGACEPACPTGAINLAAAGRGAFRILVVDDESVVRNSLDAWLGDEEGYTVVVAASGAQALAALESDPFHLMLLDIKMPGMDGVEVLQKAKSLRPEMAVLMMTAYATVETAVEAMKIGAMDYLIKPFEPDDLMPKVTSVYDTFQAAGYPTETVGAIVLATGTTCFDPNLSKNPMGYGTVPNVVTSLEFERLLSGTGPDGGRLLRPSDKRPVMRAAWIQCVGSRDLQADADFCSTICCMAALKEAAVARRRVGPEFRATIIYMDMRTFGKSFERYGRAGQSMDGVQLARGRVHSIAPTPGSDDVVIRWTNAGGAVREAAFDMVVLAVGQRPRADTARLVKTLDIDADRYGFVTPSAFSATRTRRPGIVAGGTLTGPTDIAESMIRASSAAVNASRVIHRAGGGLTDQSAAATAVRDVSRQPARILVVLCRCGGPASDPAAMAGLTARLQADPAVVRVMVLDHLCTAEDWQTAVQTPTDGFNRALVVACHSVVYGRRSDALAGAWSLDPALVEAVVKEARHEWDSPAALTLIMAGIGRLKQAMVDRPADTAVVNRALVVGGGPAGMNAALAVADHGLNVTLVEAADRLGGNLSWLDATLDGTPIAPYLEEIVGRVDAHPGIEVMTASRVVGSFGQAGHFITTIETRDRPVTTVAHGAVIVATGGREAPTDAYGHGDCEAVVTQRELALRIQAGQVDAANIRSVVMIQCVGSREAPRNYCSRVCCPTALKQALWFKARNPDLQVYVLYRDMMTCGLDEAWYTEARRQGVLFFQYEPDRKPEVVAATDRTPPVAVRLHDPVLDAPVEIAADLLVLATGIRPNLPESLALAYGATKDPDGFFQEADSKWRPVEAMRAGVFACGTALSPRSIVESVATAEAAAGRALAILTADRLPTSRITAMVRHSLCTLCLRCVETCPYQARFLDDAGRRVEVNPLLCQGCGDCATVCPNNASIVAGFNHRSLLSTIDGAMTAI